MTDISEWQYCVEGLVWLTLSMWQPQQVGIIRILQNGLASIGITMPVVMRNIEGMMLDNYHVITSPTIHLKINC